ncbi:hypothetical protein FGO68_gene15662 [Halteria grandinella]|uniref:TRP C-terminal domain-containing protein n=1 Tax=Halteria grandinella TaxID=5974 RepID=A0A8J8T9N7_HALGN|nr:hypothetical protein FGO68_gene15662 [Halteria grandinella]
MVLEGYMQYSLSSLASITNLTFTTQSDTISSSLSLAFTVFICIFPFVIWYLLWKRFLVLKDPRQIITFGSSYFEIRTDSKAALLYNVLYMIRRLVFAFLAVQMGEHCSLQAMVLIYTSILMSIYFILVRPFEEKSLNRIEVFNELCILFASYHLLLFTDFDYSDPSDTEEQHLQTQYMAGWSIIAVTTLNIIVNMAIMCYQTAQSIKEKWTNWRKAQLDKQKVKLHQVKLQAAPHKGLTPLKQQIRQRKHRARNLGSLDFDSLSQSDKFERGGADQINLTPALDGQVEAYFQSTTQVLKAEYDKEKPQIRDRKSRKQKGENVAKEEFEFKIVRRPRRLLEYSEQILEPQNQ